jgi:DNA-binding XRE family transcriptional regulator
MAKAMRQKDLAKKLCVCRESVWNWEKGKLAPRIDLWEKIAQALGATVGEIFLERREYLAILRSKAVTRSLNILEDGNSSAAQVNAVYSLVRAKEPSEEKAASIRDEEVRQDMRAARDELVAKLSRLRTREP